MINQIKPLIIIIVLAILIISTIVIFGISKSQSTKTNRLITTSFYPVEFFVKNIVGESIQVQSIVPKNISPHEYETSLQDIAKIEQSNFFVYMGAGIDGFADKIQNNLKSKNIANLAINDSLILNESSENNPQKETNPSKISYDPHTWLSPKSMLIANENLTKKIIEIYPSQKAQFEANSNKLKTKLIALDQKFAAGLAGCKYDFVVTSHDAFGYLAKSYNFKIEAVAGTEPNDQISLQEFNKITDKVKSVGVKYIFAGDDENSKTIDNLATKTGAKILQLGTMETIDQGQDYFSVMEENLKNLEIARVCG